MNTLSKILLYLLLAGLALAVLRIFHWDPFGVIDWIWNSITTIVTRIADFFVGQPWFQKIFSKPVGSK